MTMIEQERPVSFEWLTDAVHARHRTAIHEAGHAVVTYRLDFYLGPVTIRGDHARRTLGTSSGEHEWSDGSRDEDMVVTLYAGLAAERMIGPPIDASVAGARDDYDRAARLLTCVTSDQATLEKRAAALVVRYRAEIEAVAAALMEDETLEGEEADLIMDAVAEREDWRAWLADYRRRLVAVGGSSARRMPPC